VNRPLRIAFVTSHLGTGGAERHISMLAPALASAGEAPSVTCIEYEGHFGAHLRRAGVPVTDLAFAGSWKRHPLGAIRQLRRHLIATAPDVVMTNGFSAEVLSRQALRGSPRVKLVEWKHNCGHLGHYGARDRWAERLPGARVDRYLAVSHGQLPYLRDELRLDPRRTHVVHNSVPAPATRSTVAQAMREELGLSQGDVVLACVAALRVEKDHVSLLHAFARVHRNCPGSVLLLVGDGPQRANLERLTDALGVTESVRFLGVRDDVADLLAAADLVVLASTTIENLPFAVLEAMAVSTPAVCTAVGGLPELIDDGVTGRLVPPGAPDLMATCLQQLVEDAELRARMGAAARTRLIEQFPFERMVDRVRNHVRELVDEDRSAVRS